MKISNSSTIEPQTDWFRAAASSGSSGCLEFRGIKVDGRPMVQMRDSTDPDGPKLHFNRHELDCFLDGRRQGEFVEQLAGII